MGVSIKRYNAQIHVQSAIHCIIELARRDSFDPSKLVSIEADVTRIAFDFTGGGLYGVDRVVQTKEQADHNLPYLLAVALLDGDVMPAQFAPERITRADVQTIMKKVAVRPSQDYTNQYPRKMLAKIVVRLQDGTTYENEVQDYPGLASHPFAWEDSVQKFDRLVADRIDDALSREIKEAVRALEGIQVKELMELLGRVRVVP
jgi:2-methylcitrate dehydratase